MDIPNSEQPNPLLKAYKRYTEHAPPEAAALLVMAHVVHSGLKDIEAAIDRHSEDLALELRELRGAVHECL